MALLAKTMGRLQTLAYIIENPKLLSLRRKGGLVNTFISFNQPWLQALNIATVFDIGAHTGSLALTIHAAFPEAQIYSFEPLPNCFKELQMRMASVKNFTGFNIALGEEASDLMIECNTFTPSSSLLKMTDLHKNEFPYTRDSKAVSIKVERLDNIAKQITIIDPLLVKIDVQGYEDKILKGGENTIKRSKLIIVETSFKELYQGQPLFDSIYHQLTDWGFNYAGAFEQLRGLKSGQVLQEDSLFIKNS
ncbi:MAG: FkbM family methyltransferase [Coleofasciculaceae cyanobacterium]